MGSEYQLQIDGEAKFYYMIIGQEQIDEFLEQARLHPNSDIKIVKVSTETIFSMYEYGQMERHFRNLK